MPYYKWRGDGAFHDNRNDREIERGEVVELSERMAANQDFVEVDAPDEPEEEVCGAEMTDGSECQRPAGECPYHD